MYNQVKLLLVKVGEEDWLKVEVIGTSGGLASGDNSKETAAQIANQLTERTQGWAFKIPAFKAERLRRGTAEMLIDKKEAS